jgi:hypothetical protein
MELKGFFRDLAVPTGQIQALRNENLNRETLPEAGLMYEICLIFVRPVILGSY